MPNVKQTDGTFREVAYPANDTLKCIQEAVIAEYEKVIGPKPEADDEHGYLPSSPMSSLNGYLGIVLSELGRNTSLQAINGHCLDCGHRLVWLLIRGKLRSGNHSLRKSYAESTKHSSSVKHC